MIAPKIEMFWCSCSNDSKYITIQSISSVTLYLNNANISKYQKNTDCWLLGLFHCFPSCINPPTSRLIVVCLVRSLGASLGPIVASGGDNISPRPHPIVCWLVGSLSGDFTDNGGWIDAADATSRSGGIRDGGGRVWVGFDGNLEAARHGGVVVLAVCCDLLWSQPILRR